MVLLGTIPFNCHELSNSKYSSISIAATQSTVKSLQLGENKNVTLFMGHPVV